MDVHILEFVRNFFAITQCNVKRIGHSMESLCRDALPSDIFHAIKRPSGMVMSTMTSSQATSLLLRSLCINFQWDIVYWASDTPMATLRSSLGVPSDTVDLQKQVSMLDIYKEDASMLMIVCYASSKMAMAYNAIDNMRFSIGDMDNMLIVNISAVCTAGNYANIISDVFIDHYVAQVGDKLSLYRIPKGMATYDCDPYFGDRINIVENTNVYTHILSQKKIVDNNLLLAWFSYDNETMKYIPEYSIVDNARVVHRDDVLVTDHLDDNLHGHALDLAPCVERG